MKEQTQQAFTDEMLDRLFANVDETKLSKWEFDFVTSTSVWWKKNRKLSDKQRKRLAEIWRKQNATPKRTEGGSNRPQAS